VAEDAGAAAAAFVLSAFVLSAFVLSAFIRAAPDADALAPAAEAGVTATPAEALHATMPAISTAEPANSARIPIAIPLHSVCLRGSRPASASVPLSNQGIAISAHSVTLGDHDNESIRVGR